MTIVPILGVFWLAYSNGANDNFKGVATLYTGLLPEPVIPAQAGIQYAQHAQGVRWMPACAGMTATFALGQQTVHGSGAASFARSRLWVTSPDRAADADASQ